MSNSLITPSIVAREALMILENNLVAANLFHRGHTSDFTGAKVGDTITVRGPAAFTAQEFTTTTTTQDITESSVSLQLEKHFDVTVGVTSKEWTLSLDAFRQRVINPAMAAIAQKVDAYVLGKAIRIPHLSGTAGDPPDSLADLVAIDKELNDQKVPTANRIAIINSQAKNDILANVTQVLQADQRGDGGNALTRAQIGNILGISWYMDQNVQSYTAGSLTGSPLINSASVAVGDTTVAMDAGTLTGDINEGDIFTVAGDTQEYVVTADATASGNALASVAFYPAAKVAWADNAAVTFTQSSHAMNIAGDPRGLTLAVVPLELPAGAARAEYIADRGLGIRVVYDYSASTKTDTISFDVLCGAAIQDGELLNRVMG
jgi:hypothetical protein